MKKVFLIITALLLTFSVNLAAQEQKAPVKDSLGVSPSRVDMKIEADDFYENDYTITNHYDAPITVEIAVDSWNTFSGNEGIDVNDWLTVEPKTVKLKAGESKKVHFTVNTSTAMAGSLSARVIFNARPPGQEMFKLRVTTFFHVHIKGTEKINFEVLGAHFEKSDGYILGRIFIKNSGNTHIRPRGVFLMKGPKIKYRGNILQEAPVYAESTRSDFEMVIPKGLNLRPGKYTIELNLSVGSKMAKKKVKFRINKDGSLENLK